MLSSLSNSRVLEQSEDCPTLTCYPKYTDRPNLARTLKPRWPQRMLTMPPPEGPAAAQRHHVHRQDGLDGGPPALAGHAQAGAQRAADRVSGVPARHHRGHGAHRAPGAGPARCPARMGPAPAGASAARAARVQLIASMTLVAELQDFVRFAKPRQLMSYVGLVPGEQSSGPKRRQGSITKAGNSAARRMFVEVPWHCQHNPRVSPIIAKRQDDLPKAVTEEPAALTIDATARRAATHVVTMQKSAEVTVGPLGLKDRTSQPRGGAGKTLACR